MAYRNAQNAFRTLYAIATTQGGYFTAKQAAGAGYSYPHLTYHLQAGNFERTAHGLYRIPTIPVAEHDDLIRLTLWSRDQADTPQAVVSHESALFLHHLSDALPRRIHATVPPSFRKTAPKGCLLHKSTLASNEFEWREGYAVTGPLRTLLDVAASPSFPEEQLARAIEDALQKGVVRLSKLQAAARQNPPNSRLRRLAQPMLRV